MVKYSAIIPVFNRPSEVDNLLESLSRQTFKDFEALIVEDGSDQDCRKVVEEYQGLINVNYIYKDNSGPGDTRNFGMNQAKGEYFLFFDSDCIIPPEYFANLDTALSKNPADAFAGPDKSSDAFSDIQKAINFTMTSMLTTGGIRGNKKTLDNFQPRSFNMGFKRGVYEKLGGFTDIHPGEDPDLSFRIIDAGFKVLFIPEVYVYHKRRINFSKFAKQVLKFGLVRTILMKWYPEKKHWVYFLPALFLLGSILLLVLSILWTFWFLLPLVMYFGLLFVEALVSTKNPKVAFLAVVAAIVQFYWYGFGFLKGMWHLFILQKDERSVFKHLFFSQ